MSIKNQAEIEKKRYLVGGAVRDNLLNLTVKDKDWVVVGVNQQQMLDAGFQQVGKDFPVFLHPETHDEHALARTEKKLSAGYTGFTCYAEPDVTLEDDLRRRDLTINAMAQNQAGKIIDPYNGQYDLNNKTLKHVSNAFVEDPLRVLRVARFAAKLHHLGFTIAPETVDLMRTLAESGELASLTPERIWIETEKALQTPNPRAYFEALKACNALAIIYPEIDKLWGIPNPAEWHPEIDTGEHTMLVLQQACLYSDDIAIRFSALCHDLGKAVTPANEWPSHHGHEKRGVPIIKKLCDRLRIPNELKSLACIVSEFHLHTHKAFDLKAQTILKIFDSMDVWRKPERFNSFLTCCLADFTGRLGFENREYPQINYLNDCLIAANAIDIQSIIKRGFQGKAIREELTKQRITAIKTIKAAQTHNKQ
ncbi:multifunctional CCA addition/repair protein [Algibacillus agarilyticus]|uniref:multifunctional CCA addition/repair protein n=1 Tax=Algibacillus agarilyticus TaxID=2234133 RepID=UPI000DD078F1|nr:multifunctional CCA addition/repair protein [Algibacillus agarilyticus]